MPCGVSGRALRKGAEDWRGVFDAGTTVLGIGIWGVGYAGWRRRGGGSLGFEQLAYEGGASPAPTETFYGGGNFGELGIAHQIFADAFCVFGAAAMVRLRRMNQSPRRQSSRTATIAP